MMWESISSSTVMGIFQSTHSGLMADDEEEEESRAYPKLQSDYLKSSSETLFKILLSCSSIYEAAKGLLHKVCIFFNSLRPRKAADSSLLPIQNPQTPLISSTHDSSSLSISVNALESPTDLISQISCAQEPAAEENYSPPEIIGDSHALSSGTHHGEIVEEEEKRIKHYSSRYKILTVGEGDFSFSASLAVAFGSAANITATSLDSKSFLKKNYGKASSNIWELRSRGATVMHGIDATQRASNASLWQQKFDRIIFNFPFAGIFTYLSTESQLRRHRRLVSLFLKNAKEMLSEDGEIHISHKTNGNFHAQFKVESIASSHGLRLIEAVEFKRSDYPGYNTKYGFGGDDNFNCIPSATFKFALKTPPL